MFVVNKAGFLDWSWSSGSLLRSGISDAARQTVIELPTASLATQEVDADTGRQGTLHAPRVWRGTGLVREMAELDEAPTTDTRDRFTSSHAN